MYNAAELKLISSKGIDSLPRHSAPVAQRNLESMQGRMGASVAGLTDSSSVMGALQATQKIITVELTNSATSATRQALVGPGLNYVTGSESNGQIKTGSFNDLNGNSGLSGAQNVQTIEEFLIYLRNNPTVVLGLKVDSDVASQTSQTITMGYDVPWSDTQIEPKQINLATYKNEYQSNEKSVTVPFPFVFDSSFYMKVPVVASSTLSLTFFFGDSIDLGRAMKVQSGQSL